MTTEPRKTGENIDKKIMIPDITPASVRDALLFRILVPNLLFVPFIFFGFHLGPFIVALIGRYFLRKVIEDHFNAQFCYVYWLKMAYKNGAFKK